MLYSPALTLKSTEWEFGLEVQYLFPAMVNLMATSQSLTPASAYFQLSTRSLGQPGQRSSVLQHFQTEE